MGKDVTDDPVRKSLRDGNKVLPSAYAGRCAGPMPPSVVGVSRVLLTGGAGFIGTHVAAALLGAGHDVSIVDVGHPATHRTPPPTHVHGIPVRRHDLREPVDLAGVDVVVHLAALVGLGVDLDDLPEYVGCNDLATAVLLAAMARAKTRKLVLASSMVVYGEGAYTCDRHGPVRPGPRQEKDLAAGRFEPPCPHCGRSLAPGLVDESAPVDPRSVYAATKAAQEHLTSAWARQAGGTALALRFHNVYGPGMPSNSPYSGVAALFRSALADGRAPSVFEDGAQRRDFVHVRDVADAVVRATERAIDAPPGLWRAYNIASGRPATVGDLARELSRATGGPAPVVTGEYRLGDVRHVVASADRAAAELDFRAAVPLSVGAAEFADAGPRSAFADETRSLAAVSVRRR